MTASTTRSSRRAFVLHGGAALGVGMGAGVATAVGASPDDAAPPEQQLKLLRQQLDCAQDREAIRQLHVAFTSLLESDAYEAAAGLFDHQAHLQLSGASAAGSSAIRQLFTDQYRNQKAAVIHRAHRPNASQHADVVTLSEDRLQASATYHVDVQLATPLQADCTAAQMARLQGQMADCRWEAGRIEATYVKTRGQWKMASLRYQAT